MYFWCICGRWVLHLLTLPSWIPTLSEYSSNLPHFPHVSLISLYLPHVPQPNLLAKVIPWHFSVCCMLWNNTYIFHETLQRLHTDFGNKDTEATWNNVALSGRMISENQKQNQARNLNGVNSRYSLLDNPEMAEFNMQTTTALREPLPDICNPVPAPSAKPQNLFQRTL